VALDLNRIPSVFSVFSEKNRNVGVYCKRKESTDCVVQNQQPRKETSREADDGGAGEADDDVDAMETLTSLKLLKAVT